MIVGMALLLAGCQPEEDKKHEQGYRDGLRQIHAEAFFDAGLNGRNVKIGILDFGFAGLKQDPALGHLNRNGQIVRTDDYTGSTPEEFYKLSHGTNVLSYMAGIDPADREFRNNLAAGSRFYLSMVTTNFDKYSDERITEYIIDSALNDLHRQGVRLVNLSMGFWDEYSDEKENYRPEQMDGHSSVITRICQKWAMKGMIIVNSAGNTGEYKWKVIWAPSDAPEVIAVGAARFPDKVFKASYSGQGNPAISYVKPDLIAFSPWGTSYSANVVTGIIACMLQKDSTLSLSSIRDILFRSSTLYPCPNNYVGYGIPDARKILELMDHPDRNLSSVRQVRVPGSRYTIQVSGRDNVVFEKTDHYRVKRQIIDEANDGTIELRRRSGIAFTTVVAGEKVYELEWNLNP